MLAVLRHQGVTQTIRAVLVETGLSHCLQTGSSGVNDQSGQTEAAFDRSAFDIEVLHPYPGHQDLGTPKTATPNPQPVLIEPPAGVAVGEGGAP